jgi:thiopeptide-type bacteriocin biosynthesis protein
MTTPAPEGRQFASPRPGEAVHAQCLARGLVGDALQPIERARNGTGPWREAHAALAAATRYPVIATPDTSLYLGAPAIAFTLHAADDGSGRYARPRAALDAQTDAITRQRLLNAHARIDAGLRPRTSEYDVFYGLTGLGMMFLASDPASPLLPAILAYLVRLTRPLLGDNRRLPGWWTARDPRGGLSAAFPSGHLNLGMAHGIAGPLALMSACVRRGITTAGLHDAITRICAVLDACRQESPAGTWWPGWIALPEYTAGRPGQTGPGRPSFCYGTPGLARAQHLAGIALGDISRQNMAVHALRRCLTDPDQLSRISDATLCHGTAGILITTRYAAADAPPGTYTTILRHIRALHDSLPALPRTGLLEGSTGRNLASLSDDADGRTASGWEACILPARGPAKTQPMTQPGLPSPGQPAGAVERAVLAMLTGAPADQAASQAGITPRALAAAARAYQQAGRAALAAHGGPAETWEQAVVEFTDWDTAERTVAAVLAPRLQNPEVTAGWWFLRKYPCWRIRYLPPVGAVAGLAKEQVASILDDMTTASQVRSWRPGIYEPESLAFGGPEGIRIAHRLFCADSLGVIATFGHAPPAHAADHPAGRKELSILLCATLMRGAGLDWFEQGDTWQRITSLRPLPASTSALPQHDAIKVLLAADTSPANLLSTFGGSTASAAAWAGGFRQAGQAFAATATAGQLERGLRDILAHLIIFHWNRLGLTATAQAILARAAQDVIMNTASEPATAGGC